MQKWLIFYSSYDLCLISLVMNSYQLFMLHMLLGDKNRKIQLKPTDHDYKTLKRMIIFQVQRSENRIGEGDLSIQHHDFML